MTARDIEATGGRAGDFRARARAVRAAARLKLREFRRSRLRAAATPSEATEPAAITEAPHEAFADDAPDLLGAMLDEHGVPDGPDPEPEAGGAWDAAQAIAPCGAAADAARDMLVSRDVASFVLAASTDDAPLAADADAPSPAEAGTQGAAAVSGSLAALPGVGPGLVWLLERAGVRSVADLCAADPAALTERLGLVGRLVDVESLRRLAHDNAAARR